MKTNIMPECYVDTNLIEYHKDFRRLFTALRSHHEMAGLAATIKYLDAAQYSADIEKLKQILI